MNPATVNLEKLNPSGKNLIEGKIKDALGDLIKQTLTLDAIQRASLQRISLEITGQLKLSPFDWLMQQDSEQKIFWSTRDGDFTVAAVGVVDRVAECSGKSIENAIDQIKQKLNNCEDQRIKYYGAVQFPNKKAGNGGKPVLDAISFCLPKFEYIEKNGKQFIVLNVKVNKNENLDALVKTHLASLTQLHLEPCKSISSKPLLISRVDSPSKPLWIKQVQEVIRQIGSSDLKKVVLARNTRLVFQERVDPTYLFRLLAHQKSTFRFYHQVHQGCVFLGASPELFYRKIGDRLETEAVAGTIGRSGETARDQDLAQELLNSSKDQSEHHFVVESIQKALAPFCSQIDNENQFEVIKLPTVQHLRKRFEVKLKPFIRERDLITSMNPTAAVGGVPKVSAIEWIDETESFSRGWYSGIIGWLSRNNSEFAVAIRSALIQDNIVDVKAGAGVVGESDAEKEWCEIESKIDQFIQILC